MDVNILTHQYPINSSASFLCMYTLFNSFIILVLFFVIFGVCNLELLVFT